MIVTLDGPAGVGKSSAAKALAERIGFEFLDTGAMYRAVALAAVEAGVDAADETALSDLLKHTRLGFRPDRVFVNSRDVTETIRTPEVTRLAGVIAQSAGVRDFLVRMQRIMASGRDMVTEGRDQGTVVFPDAGCKFFLTAQPRERALRRWRDLSARGVSMTVEQILADQEERDRRDAARAIGPMKPAEDAVLLDTTDMTFSEVIEFLEVEVRCRRSHA
jgi:CMP/dCMP kinase